VEFVIRELVTSVDVEIVEDITVVVVGKDSDGVCVLDIVDHSVDAAEVLEIEVDLTVVDIVVLVIVTYLAN